MFCVFCLALRQSLSVAEARLWLSWWYLWICNPPISTFPLKYSRIKANLKHKRGTLCAPRRQCSAPNHQHLGLWPYLETAFADVVKLRYGSRVKVGPETSTWRPYKEKGTGTQRQKNRRECLVTRDADPPPLRDAKAAGRLQGSTTPSIQLLASGSYRVAV